MWCVGKCAAVDVGEGCFVWCVGRGGGGEKERKVNWVFVGVASGEGRGGRGRGCEGKRKGSWLG